MFTETDLLTFSFDQEVKAIENSPIDLMKEVHAIRAHLELTARIVCRPVQCMVVCAVGARQQRAVPSYKTPSACPKIYCKSLCNPPPQVPRRLCRPPVHLQCPRQSLAGWKAAAPDTVGAQGCRRAHPRL